MKRQALLAALSAFAAMVTAVQAQDNSFVLATTTSTENSGLLDAIIPKFTNATKIEIDVVAVGTGQALALGRRGDAAALLTHDRVGEDQFVAGNHGADRRDVMYNDFVIIGPADDPADLQSAGTAVEALQAIEQNQALFVSRGDDSGTHRKEHRLWTEADIAPTADDNWYRETGSGMGQTILTATQMGAYTLADRATWTRFAQKADFAIAYEGDPPLNNPYSSILVTHSALPEQERSAALKWHEWLTSEQGRTAINAFEVDGQQLFFVD